MNTRLLLSSSLLLNLVLVGWLLVLSRRPFPPVASHIPSRNVSSALAPSESLQSPAAPVLKQADTPLVRFDWRQVESDDYKQYLANLRAIGCPEKTVKEIIQADVNDLFSTRMASVTRTNQYRYWMREPMARGVEQEQQLRDLDTQKRQVLKTLGVDESDFKELLQDAFRDSVTEMDLQLDFLPAPKKQDVKDLLFAKAQRELAGETPEEARETATKIQALLTPEEFREYELRCSDDAIALRGVLADLTPTELEFRSIFDSWRRLKAISAGTPEYSSAQNANEAALRQLLGPERFDLYLRDVKLLGYSN